MTILNYRLKITLVSLFVIGVLGFSIRLNAAINQSLWQDEVYILDVSKQYSLNQLFLLQQEDKAHPQLYYILSNIISRYNTSPLALRLPSLVSFIPTFLFVYLIGTTVFSRRVAFMASLIFAFHPFYVNQGFQAKMYGLTYFFVFGGLYFTLLSIKNQKLRWSILSGLFNAAAFYTDYSTVWYLLSLFAGGLISSLAWREHRRSLWKSLLLTFLITALLITVDLPLFVGYFREAAVGEYLGKNWYWYARNTVADFSGSWNLPAMINAIAPNITNYVVWPIFILSILIFLLCLTALASSINTASAITEKYFGVFLLSSYFIPVFSSYLFSILYSPIFNTANIWISGLPFIYGLAVLFIRSRKKLLPSMLILVYILTFGITSAGRWGFFGSTNWNGLTKQLLSYPGHKDIVMLDFEGPIWARMMSFTDYYLEFPPNNPLKRYVTLHEIDMSKPVDNKLINKLAERNQLWLLSNADNASSMVERERNHQIVSLYQALLQCENKPCNQAFAVRRD